MIKRSDITLAYAEKAVSEHGGIVPAARFLAKTARKADGEPASARTVRTWLEDAMSGSKDASQVALLRGARADAANKFLKLLDDGNIDPQIIADGEIKIESGHFKTHGAFAKLKKADGSEELVTKSLYSIGVKLSPAWEKGPQFPLILPCKPVRVQYAPAKQRTDGIKVVAFIPDMHVGFIRPLTDDTKLLPSHDISAIDVAMQIVADLQPHQMFNLGDAIDLPEHSEYEKHPEHDRTTQRSLVELRDILAAFEAAAGPLSRREPTLMHGGNHGNRFARFALGHNKASYGLRTAESPKGWPVLSLPFMVGTDSLGIKYVGDKIGAEHYLTDDLKVIHEPPKGKTDDPLNIVCAHDHKIWRKSETVFLRGKSKVYTTYGMGCLARIDRYDDESSLLAHYVPGNWQKQRWQHCIGVAYIHKDGSHYIEQVPIENGRALFRGKLYIGRTTAPWRKLERKAA